MSTLREGDSFADHDKVMEIADRLRELPVGRESVA
jgi:hypothetical protein